MRGNRGTDNTELCWKAGKKMQIGLQTLISLACCSHSNLTDGTEMSACFLKHRIMLYWNKWYLPWSTCHLIDMRNVKRNWCHFWRKLASIPKRTFISCPAQDWLEQTLKNSQNSVLGICMYLKLSNLNICCISIKVNASVKLGGSRAWYVVVVCQSAWRNKARATRTQPCNVPMKSLCKLHKIISKILAVFFGCVSALRALEFASDAAADVARMSNCLMWTVCLKLYYN